jgi:hypothetical protein
MSDDNDNNWERAKKLIGVHYRKSLAKMAKEIIRDESKYKNVEIHDVGDGLEKYWRNLCAIEKVYQEMGKMALWARGEEPEQKYHLKVIKTNSTSIESDINHWLNAHPNFVPYTIQFLKDENGKAVKVGILYQIIVSDE